LLGVTACNKHYIGRDLNTQAVDEAQQIIAFHNLDAEVSCHDILTAQPESYNCILTCPPYYNKETYSTETEFKTCDEWIEIVLNKYNCEKYVFVVDKTKQFNQYVQEELITKSHFNATSEKVIVINNA
jgi:23S rRNA A1618 N6-methylase RlmF